MCEVLDYFIAIMFVIANMLKIADITGLVLFRSVILLPRSTGMWLFKNQF